MSFRELDFPYHFHGQDVNPNISDRVRETVDEKWDFGRVASCSEWVPVVGDWVALLCFVSFTSPYIEMTRVMKGRERGKRTKIPIKANERPQILMNAILQYIILR